MRFLLAILFLNMLSFVSAQWTELEIPLATRYDDVYFFNENLGWAAGGNNRTVYKTIDGGETWTAKFTAANYLRSIEFASESLGFAGTLNGELYQSTDGGESWTDITARLPQSVPGICGLAAPSENVIYGCGKWSGNDPPVIIKSGDGGTTWTVTDLSTLATQLVEVFFLDENKGFASGMANPRTDGGIILQTLDGGENWSVLHKTMQDRDYIWKIQTPDSVNFFGSIQSLPTTENVRFVKSTDGAASWTTELVTSTKWNYMQMIGFKDAMNGWTGGTANANEGSETALFVTSDGGSTWDLSNEPTESFKTFNRFFMLNDDHVFMTGRRIYKYDPDATEEPITLSLQVVPEHSLNVYPNPAENCFSIAIHLTNDTTCWLEVFDENGKVIQEVFKGELKSGKKDFPITTEKMSSGKYFVVLHTNENMIYRHLTVK